MSCLRIVSNTAAVSKESVCPSVPERFCSGFYVSCCGTRRRRLGVGESDLLHVGNQPMRLTIAVSSMISETLFSVSLVAHYIFLYRRASSLAFVRC